MTNTILINLSYYWFKVVIHDPQPFTKWPLIERALNRRFNQ